MYTYICCVNVIQPKIDQSEEIIKAPKELLCAQVGVRGRYTHQENAGAHTHTHTQLRQR